MYMCIYVCVYICYIYYHNALCGSWCCKFIDLARLKWFEKQAALRLSMGVAAAERLPSCICFILIN